MAIFNNVPEKYVTSCVYQGTDEEGNVWLRIETSEDEVADICFVGQSYNDLKRGIGMETECSKCGQDIGPESSIYCEGCSNK